MTPKAYSPRQLAIIRGELPEEKYTLMQCRQILVRAEKACDHDVIRQMTAVMEKKADDPMEIKRAMPFVSSLVSGKKRLITRRFA